MARDTDDWPERIAIPTIRESTKMVDWVRDCLSTERRRQSRARLALVLAIYFLRKAVKVLEKNE